MADRLWDVEAVMGFMDILKLTPDPRLDSAPGPTAFDYSLVIAKVAALAFPPLGGGVALFDLITAPLRGKRMSEWCEELRLRLNELSQKIDGLTPESLAGNDAFVSAFALATHAALRSHQAEKLEALRNAVINVAIGRAPSEDLQTIFLSLVDTFTPMHLRTLNLFRSPDGALRESLRSQRDLSDQVVLDLRDRGLVKDPRPYVARNRESSQCLVSLTWETTKLGKQFLDFIESPGNASARG